MTPKFLVGIGWYSEDQWTMLKLLADDPDNLDATYQGWKAGAQKAFEQMQKEPGIEAVKVPVDVDALLQWCRERGKPLNGASRSEYVLEIVQRTGKN